MLFNSVLALAVIGATGAQATRVSPNARCGKQFGEYTCQGSRWGNCCSQYGYCGSTKDYCDAKTCQRDFGSCNGSPKPSTSVRTTLTFVVRPSTSSSRPASSAPQSICSAVTTTLPASTITVTIPGEGPEPITTTVNIPGEEPEPITTTVTIPGEGPEPVTTTVTIRGEEPEPITTTITVPGEKEITTLTVLGEKETTTVLGNKEIITLPGEVQTITHTVEVTQIQTDIQTLPKETVTDVVTQTQTDVQTLPAPPASTDYITVTAEAPPAETIVETITAEAPPAETVVETITAEAPQASTLTLPAATVTAIATTEVASCPTGNPIKNGDFESNLSGSWTVLEAGDADVEIASTGQGNKALRARINSTNGNMPQRIVQAVTVCPGANYRVSFTAKRITTSGTVMATLYVNDIAMAAVSNPSGTSFVPAQLIGSGIFSTTSNSVLVRLEFTYSQSVNTQKEIQVDDVVFTRI